MTAFSVNIVIGITFLLVGLCVGEILKRVQDNPTLPKGIRWVTVGRVVYFLMVCLALSSMLTTYSVTNCQTEFNKANAERALALSNSQEASTESLIKTVDGFIEGSNNMQILIDLRTDLREQQRVRREHPIRTEERC